MKIATGVEMLALEMNNMGGGGTMHPTLIWDEETVILVDTGLPGQFPQLKSAIEATGVPFSKLNKIIITHQDIDHIGNLPAIINEASQQIEVLAHSAEVPYIQGEERLVKVNPERMKRMAELPEEQRKQAEAMYSNPPRATVSTYLTDGEKLPYCGGITIIHTPGHTPGHICLYLEQSKTLIAGDALNVAEGQLMGPNPQFTPDMEQAKQSLDKLKQYAIDKVICYHGVLYQGNVQERLAELIKG